MANTRPLALLSTALPSLALLLGACTITPKDAVVDPQAYPELKREMAELEAEQRRFAATTTLPIKLEFPDNGRVTVRQLELEGYPGNTYLKARWHYQNTTGRPLLRALVSLDVLDAEGRMVASKVSVCIFPTPRPILDATFFADELRTQTHDVHLQPGWSWRMTCKAEYIEEEDYPIPDPPR